MSVLFLGPKESPLIAWLQSQGERVIQTAEKISAKDISGESFLVSYGYRHILRKDVLNCFPRRAINLHISYLPWNRGADPNFWSFVENTPKGVTIHYLDEGIDTGDIIAQKRIEFEEGHTLATSYVVLQEAIQELFKQHWPVIRYGCPPWRKQVGEGSTHRARDKERLTWLLTSGWDTPVSVLQEYGDEVQQSAHFWEQVS